MTAENTMPTTARRLIGVGVGPGDPSLITVKAARALESADVVLVPATEASEGTAGRAELIVAAACQLRGRLVRIPFSMSQKRGLGSRRLESWAASANAAIEAFRDGASSVAFATVGDPSVYSTFSYLAATVAEQIPGLDVDVIPGITAMQALAAESRTPLVEGQEVLCLFPHTAGSDRLSQVLSVADTITVYKGGRKLPEVLSSLRAADRRAVIGHDVSLPNQSLVEMSPDPADDASAHYFSAVLSAPVRDRTGGRI